MLLSAAEPTQGSIGIWTKCAGAVLRKKTARASSGMSFQALFADADLGSRGKHGMS